jgi:hypothetical protein
MDTTRSVDAINRVLRNLVQCVGVLWRQLQQVGTEERGILAVMPALSGQDNLHVWSI